MALHHCHNPEFMMSAWWDNCPAPMTALADIEVMLCGQLSKLLQPVCAGNLLNVLLLCCFLAHLHQMSFRDPTEGPQDTIQTKLY